MGSSTGDDSRKVMRHKVEKHARLLIGESAAIDIQIRDLSVGGARLVVPEDVKLPSMFRLQIAESQFPIPVRTCWRSAEQTGVRFLSPREAEELDENRLSPEGETGDQRSGSAGPFPPSEANEASGPSFLAVEYQLRFEHLPGQVRGRRCVVDVKLRNSHALDALHPFMCVPAMGLMIEPAAFWVAREIVLVRKMIRFGYIKEASLSAGEMAACCHIVLPFSPGNGGIVHYAHGLKYPLSHLPDLRLACQVGAANFPAGRLQLTVPASRIAGYLLDHVGLDGEPPRVAVAGAGDGETVRSHI